MVKQTRRPRAGHRFGTGSNSTKEAIELTRLAAELGADATLQVGPYYNKPTQDGLFNHFAAIAAASDLPLIIYNIPGQDRPQHRAQDHHPAVGGDPERGGPQGLLQRPASDHGDLPGHRSGDLQDLLGEDIMTFSLLCHGAAGAIAAVAHVVGREVKAMCEAVWAGRSGGGAATSTTASWTSSTPCSSSRTPPRSSRPSSGWDCRPARCGRRSSGMTPAGQEVLRAAMVAGGWLA